MKVNLAYRLGLKVFVTAGQCISCSADSDATGDHAISCGGQGERIMRHNSMRDVLYQTAVQAGLCPDKRRLHSSLGKIAV